MYFLSSFVKRLFERLFSVVSRKCGMGKGSGIYTKLINTCSNVLLHVYHPEFFCEPLLPALQLAYLMLWGLICNSHPLNEKAIIFK